MRIIILTTNVYELPVIIIHILQEIGAERDDGA